MSVAPSSSIAPFSAENKRSLIPIRCSQVDGPLRRPLIATPLVRHSPPTPTAQPNPPPFVSSPPETTPMAQNVVTMEFQRQKVKELSEVF